MKFVVHDVNEKQRKQSRGGREEKQEPPTGCLISFD